MSWEWETALGHQSVSAGRRVHRKHSDENQHLDEWINKIWYLHMVEYDRTLKKE